MAAFVFPHWMVNQSHMPWSAMSQTVPFARVTRMFDAWLSVRNVFYFYGTQPFYTLQAPCCKAATCFFMSCSSLALLFFLSLPNGSFHTGKGCAFSGNHNMTTKSNKCKGIPVITETMLLSAWFNSVPPSSTTIPAAGHKHFLCYVDNLESLRNMQTNESSLTMITCKYKHGSCGIFREESRWQSCGSWH